MRLASFNLLSGRCLADGSVDQARLVEAVGMLDADVLAVQELDQRQPRSAGVDQAALIATAMGAAGSRFVPTVLGTPGERGWRPADQEPDGSGGTGEAELDPSGPCYGVALISRLPVARWQVLRLRPARGRYPVLIPTRRPQVIWLNDEPRAAIAAVLERPRITIACTHLSFVPLVNAVQLVRVRRWLESLPGPVVLMGDLNLPGSLPGRITRWTPLVSGPTFPSPAPRLQLDHILARGLPPGSRASGSVLELPISDHRAVQVDLVLPGPPDQPDR